MACPSSQTSTRAGRRSRWQRCGGGAAGPGQQQRVEDGIKAIIGCLGERWGEVLEVSTAAWTISSLYPNPPPPLTTPSPPPPPTSAGRRHHPDPRLPVPPDRPAGGGSGHGARHPNKKGPVLRALGDAQLGGEVPARGCGRWGTAEGRCLWGAGRTRVGGGGCAGQRWSVEGWGGLAIRAGTWMPTAAGGLRLNKLL